MDHATRRKLFNQCRPDEPLEAADERYADADALGARGSGFTKTLAAKIESSGRPECSFVTAVPGTGMTTELNRLAAQLARADGANLLPVRVDAQEVLDLTAPIATAEILVAIVHRAEQAVLEAACDEAPRAHRGYWGRLTEGLHVDDGADLLGVLAKSPRARMELHRRIDPEMSRFVAETRQELVLLNERARQIGREGLVVIVDSLERLQGISANDRQVRESAERVFHRSEGELELPIPSVYTVPVGLLTRTTRAIEVLPVLALHDRDGCRIEPGYEAARKLARRRIPEPSLDELLGFDNPRARLDTLLAWTGGKPREIVFALRELLTSGGRDKNALDKLLYRIYAVPRQLATDEDARALACVLGRGSLEAASEEQRASVEKLLATGLLLPYAASDGSLWFGAPPGLDELLAPASSRRRLAAL